MRTPLDRAPSCVDALWTAAGHPRTIMLPRAAPQKVSSSANPNPRVESCTDPPTHQAKVPGWSSLCPAAPGLGTPSAFLLCGCFIVKKKKNEANSPKQVPPQESQTKQIKEKHKVTFKWHRGSRKAARVPPGVGGLAE